MSTDDAQLMSEAELTEFLARTPPAFSQPTQQFEADLEHRLRTLGGDPAVEAMLDLDDVSEERLDSLENRLLLLAGTVCVQAGHPELWSTIWRIWHAGELFGEDEFEVLAEMTARARVNERSLVDEAATIARWQAS